MNDWDVAYAQTEEREVINPRPLDEAQIFRTLQPFAGQGFLTYSEGCNDDVNKAVWSALGWNPDVDELSVLREYGRYFIGPDMAERFAEGLLSLERNWRGPLLTNARVDETLAGFQEMERRASVQQKLNWRFQQAVYRANYDAYLRARLLDETNRERLAMQRLATAKQVGSVNAMSEAESLIATDPDHRAGAALRARVFEMGEALFQSIHMQLSVPRYAAIDPGRGANLDLIDRPITNAPWLRQRFAEIRVLETESDRIRAIEGILNWTNPGPGGFFDDLGDPMNRPHLVPGTGFAKDPDFFHTARTGFVGRRAPLRVAWLRHAEALYGNTLKLQYTGLDPAARYKVRYAQAGDSSFATRLMANGAVEIHPLRKTRGRCQGRGIRYSSGDYRRRYAYPGVAAGPQCVRQRPIRAGLGGLAGQAITRQAAATASPRCQQVADEQGTRRDLHGEGSDAPLAVFDHCRRQQVPPVLSPFGALRHAGSLPAAGTCRRGRGGHMAALRAPIRRGAEVVAA